MNSVEYYLLQFFQRLLELSFGLKRVQSGKVFAKTYQYSDMASFFLKWGETAENIVSLFLQDGETNYRFLLSLPLIYFFTE